MQRTRLRTSLLLNVCCLALSVQAIGAAQVLINEVLYRIDPSNSDPLKKQQWVELFNKGTNAVDVTGWTVSGRDGSGGGSARKLPAASIPGGGYLVVHFATGTNRLGSSDGTGDVYTQDTVALWSADMDEAVLYSPNAIVDFIAWGDAAVPYAPGKAGGDAVAAGIWTAGAALNSDFVQVLSFERPRRVAPGESIGRDPDSTDTNATADFEPHGGVAALDNTPNQRNLSQINVQEVDPPATASQARDFQPNAAPRRRWTVMLYFNGDNSLEVDMYRQVQAIEKAGGSDANVNLVLMFDGKRFVTGTYRGLLKANGDPTKLLLQRVLGESTQIGERDMADPAQLSIFIAWAKANYPADHYALFLGAHGDGWKSWGPDETSKGKYGSDFLYMGELRTALTGQHFDLIGFDACMMAAIEVADQIRDFTDYVVGSEEVAYGYPYEVISQALQANPDWTGLQLGQNVVASYAGFFAGSPAAFYPQWSQSLIDEHRLIELIQQVDAWSVVLRNGAGLFQGRDNFADNVQVRIKLDLLFSQVFHDVNFVDLYDLAQHILKDPVLPNCVKGPIPNILTLISQVVVVAEQHSVSLPGAHGLHIYFPVYRKRAELFPQAWDDYDLPSTRQTDGNSRLAIYAENHDELPLQARDRQDGGPLNARTQWPEPPTPQLLFVAHTRWPLFLERYYHPVADNHIVEGVAPDGSVIHPVEVGGGECANPVDEITVPLGSEVTLSGRGSSAIQADLAPAPNIPPVPFFFPSYYFWDLDASVGCQLGPQCIQPSAVAPPGSDAAQNSNDNMDQDRAPENTAWDEKDASGPQITKLCKAVGQFVLTLIPWDSDHTFPFHDTKVDAHGIGDATYVHPQTDSHQSIVNCTPLPVTLLLDEPPPGITVNEEVFGIGIVKGAEGAEVVSAQPARASRPGRLAAAAATAAPAPSIPNYPLLISTTPGTPPLVASGTAIAPGGSATVYTDGAGVFSLRFTPTATGPGQITVKVLGGPTQTISFTVSPALAVNKIAVAGPANGQIAVGQPTSIAVQATNNGQAAINVPVNFTASFGNVAFLSGTPFAQGFGSQVKTDATGTAHLNLMAIFPGMEQIVINVGAITGSLNLTITGTPPAAPTGMGVLSAPSLVAIGQQASVVAVVVAGPNPFPGAKVTFQAAQGNVSFSGAPGVNQVTVTSDANGLATATFAANDPTPILLRLNVAGTQLSATASIPVLLQTDLGGPQPGAMSISAVTNAASGAATSVAPGEIVTLYGKGLGPADLAYFQFIDGAIPTELAGVQILFNGIAAPLIYVRENQSAAIVPYGISVFGQTTVRVEVGSNGTVSPAVTLPITATLPGVFSADASGSGQGAIQNSDLRYNTASNPAAAGSVIVLYLSGLGAVNPPEADGSLTPASGVPTLAASAQVTIGGKPAQIAYQGPAPGAVAGLYQINCIVPTGLPAGNAAVLVSSGGQQSQANLTVAVK
jgi:uncharacterized protein (TIGR03437 family)